MIVREGCRCGASIEARGESAPVQRELDRFRQAHAPCARLPFPSRAGLALQLGPGPGHHTTTTAPGGW